MITQACTVAHRQLHDDYAGLHRCTQAAAPLHTGSCTVAHRQLHRCTQAAVPLHIGSCTVAHRQLHHCTQAAARGLWLQHHANMQLAPLAGLCNHHCTSPYGRCTHVCAHSQARVRLHVYNVQCTTHVHTSTQKRSRTLSLLPHARAPAHSQLVCPRGRKSQQSQNNQQERKTTGHSVPAHMHTHTHTRTGTHAHARIRTHACRDRAAAIPVANASLDSVLPPSSTACS